MTEPTKDLQRVRRALMRRGIFPPRHLLPSPSSTGSGAARKKASRPTEDGNGAEVPPSILLETETISTRTTHGAELIVATDYAMMWKESLDYPSTTHELCFDLHNGFDEDYLYVSGMNVNKMARISRSDPTQQTIFSFPPIDGLEAEPHTLRFANIKSDDLKGKLWVGLENQGRIVELDMRKVLEKYKSQVNNSTTTNTKPPTIKLTEADYESILDVRINAGDSTPTPINTRPHGFCFDATNEYIWFTGKLTNTVGRIKLDGTAVQHFELPTLGAIPIYVACGPDGNIWGTCLANGIIFRATTGTHPTVDEMHITRLADDRRPIAIKPDPRNHMPFMWFSTEAGHSICRLDTRAFAKYYAKADSSGGAQTRGKNNSMCTCSPACQHLFRKQQQLPQDFKTSNGGEDLSTESVYARIITEFPVPKVNHHMKLGGLALAKDGTVWTQSYVDKAENSEGLPDYILRLDFPVHDPTNTHDKKKGRTTGMTGLPIQFYELPTKDTILHRISMDQDDEVWFTELGADRVGTIRIESKRAADTNSTQNEESPATKKRKLDQTC